MNPAPLCLSLRLAMTAGLAAVAATPALAQQSDPSRVTPTQMDTVVVTGRAGVIEKTKAETSYSITTIDEERLRLQAPTSVTESLKSVPGFWVESSGGEAGGNVRARGVPVDGFGSINLLEDGVPVQHDPALGWLNGDQTFRLDETIDRIEVVRGGPSSILYPNAPAGAVNFIPRRVGDGAEGLYKLTVGDAGLFRNDFWFGAPIGDWEVALGGFYRSEDGIRDPGYTANDGGQVRLSLGRAFDRGRVDVDVKRLDDSVAFYLGIPMRMDENGDIRAVPGVDGTHGTIAGPETSLLRLTTGDGGDYLYDNTKGIDIKRTQATLKFQYEIADGWQFENALRFNDTETDRAGVTPNSVLGAATFLEQAAAYLPAGAAGLQLRYVNDPQTVFDVQNQNGNGLVIVGGLRAITAPVREFINDARLSHTFEAGSQRHDLSLGYYHARIEEDFQRYSSSALLEARDNARLLDLVAVDADGNALGTLSDNGIWRHGYEWENASGESTTQAVYLVDEWQVNDRLRIDGGLRWEQMHARGRVEIRETVDLGTLATSQILTGSGRFAHYDNKFDDIGWTLGANWQFDRNSGLFARYTSANRLPSLGSYITNATATPVVQTMALGELGYKFANQWLDFYATAFWTKYDNVSFNNIVFDVNSNIATVQQGYADTQTLGLELEAAWYPVEWFDVSLSATLQDPEYRGLIYNELVDGVPVERNYEGNQLIRVPKAGLRLVPGFNLLDGRLRLQATWERQGERFSDTANSVSLPSYDVFGASARFQANDRWSIYLYGDNLGNSLGLTEGNPRAGELQSIDAGADTFIARPLLGRSLRLAVMYKF